MINIQKIKQQKTIKELLEFGILNLDKPQNPTSFDVSDFVRKSVKDFGVRKTSHFGTLDPKVTGVLPIALNRACKLARYFLGENKTYVGIMRIHEDIVVEKIKETIKEKFTGTITQLPPVKSRVKRQERQREIKKFELLEKEGKDILFNVECQGGTYIRKLVHDFGRELKIGAHMIELRRIKAGIFCEDDEGFVNLYEFEKAVEECKKGREELLKKIIIPGEVISKIFPVVQIKENNLKKIFTGKPIHNEDLALLNTKDTEAGKIVAVFSEDKFVGMYKVINSDGVFAKPEFVFNPLSVYM